MLDFTEDKIAINKELFEVEMILKDIDEELT